MKRSLAILLLFLLGPVFQGVAQPHGNEWIRYDQQYFRFPVPADGIYRIDHATLSGSGVPVSSLKPGNFQIYGREREVSIHVEGGADGSLDPGDYIEFYGRSNDGWLDSLVYPSQAAHTDPYYSLYNDTATYYLTWNGNLANKRVDRVTDTDLGSYPSPDHLWKKTIKSYHANYEFGFKDRFGGTSPRYTAGEGWVSGKFSKGSTEERDIETPHPYQAPGAPDARVEGAVASVSDAKGSPNHHLQVLTPKDNVVFDSTYSGYDLINYSVTFSNSQLDDPTTPVQHRSVDDLGVKTDFQTTSYITIAYPHTGNAGQKSAFDFRVPHDPSTSKAHVRISSLDANEAVMYRLNGKVKRIKVVNNGNVKEALVPHLSSGENARCHISALSEIREVGELTPVSRDNDGFFTDYGAKAADSTFLIITHEKLAGAAQDYADFRKQRFDNTMVVGVEELYHQFGGGIRKSGLALRRFARFLVDEWSMPPQSMFLIGKNVAMEYGARNNGAHYSKLLVPSFGFPPSDNLITAGLDGASSLEPRIPVGRLAANDEKEVLEYLEKMKEHEAWQGKNGKGPREWMKRALHFGGGGTANEQETFAGFLRNYESIIEDTSFGGRVHTFLKESSDPIQISISDSVTDLIENGVSLMTFFGHASGSGFDQNIDHPSNYDNQNRYPLVLANACYTGDIHQPSTNSTSEEFVLIGDRGMIGFIASVKLGYVGTLNRFSTQFYKNLGYRNYGEPLGKVFQGALADFEDVAGNGFLPELTALEMTLHGDPALKLHTRDKPELKVSEPELFFEPKEITPRVDSFTVHVPVANIGRATTDTFRVELTRNFPGTQDDSLYQKDLPGLLYRDTVRFRLPVQPDIANGLNEFDLSVDHPEDRIEEAVDEFNNNTVFNKTLLIRTDGIVPVHPYEYAIIPNEEVSLKASTGDPFADKREYVFEIDTTDRFNSPLKRRTTIMHEGGVLSWKPDMTFTDSTVYFWRVAPKGSGNPDLNWAESSFQYIPGERGWGQAHFFQFKKDRFNQLQYDRDDRRVRFQSGSEEVSCRVYGNPSNGGEIDGTLWRKGFEQQEYGGCTFSPSIHVGVIDPVTLESWGSYGKDDQGNWVNEDHQFGNANNGNGCRSRVEKYFIFRQNNEQSMKNMERMLRDSVPDGHYILVYSWIYADYGDGWSATDLPAWFQSQGADSVGAGQDKVPFIFFVKKGEPATAKEVYGEKKDDFITLSALINGKENQGFLTSEMAGPSGKWDALYWDTRSLEQNTSDATDIEVIGIKENGDADVVADFPASRDSVPDLEKHVDASVYPFVRLRADLRDSVDQTPAQIDRWQLLHQPKPEAALNPSRGHVFQSDTLREGQEMAFSVPVENISPYPMDSLLVSYWIENGQGGREDLKYPRQDSLLPGEVLKDTIRTGTAGLTGDNRLWMEVNPLDSTTGTYDQLEKFHFNNIASLNFHSKKDRINPILDVTVDGRHIMDGDIVSTNPDIRITLNDENRFLYMDEPEDTANFNVWLTDPDGNQKRVHFRDGSGKPIMEWTPADPPENHFKIRYNPELEKDGQYELLVQAQDKSGNASGDHSYKVAFEVEHEQTVTNVLNYPNPFSTRTQFVFTLTGTEPPDRFKIRIMTVSGKVVREITKDELGPLNIGVNRTDYWWDGRDEHGDPLGNGIYLYQVIVKDNGKAVDKRETGADWLFEEGFGKMYLMR